MFKAMRKDGKGEVKGWLCYNNHEQLCIQIKREVVLDELGADLYYLIPIIPLTLSMQTGKKDKNKEEICGFFSLDNKMTTGCDRVLFRGGTYSVGLVNGSWKIGQLDGDNVYFLYNILSEDLEIIKG